MNVHCPKCKALMVVTTTLSCPVNPSHTPMVGLSRSEKAKARAAVRKIEHPEIKIGRQKKLIEAFGEKKTADEWAEDMRCGKGVSADLIRRRLRYNWPWKAEDAIQANNCYGENIEDYKP